jgi:two-component system, LytTR family, sensor kinase
MGSGTTGRRWLAIGSAAWLGITALYTVTHGFRRLAHGLPFYASWQQVGHVVSLMVMGALLSAPVFLVFRWLRARPRPGAIIAATYVLLGIGYWLAWAGLWILYMRILDPGTAALPIGDVALRAVVFSALVALTLYTAMAFIFEAAWHRTRVRERELDAARLQIELDEARTAALRARVDPGFLTGAFAIASDLMASDVQAARSVLADLSELLRVALGRNGGQFIEFRREVELARRVIAVHQAGLFEPVPVDVRVGPDVLGLRLQPLTLQPLLTEAFRWVGRAETRTGRIEIAAETADGALRISVAATGPDPRPAPPAQGPPLGFDTLHAHLAKLYGDRAVIRIATPAPHRLELDVDLPASPASPTWG